MNTIRTAVVGVGHQGRWHAEKFAALEASHLVTVVDADSERCRAVASDLGVGAVGEVRDLIGTVDAVSIATPTPSHFGIASTLLDNGIHVLLEKPLTATVGEARELVDLAERRKLVLQVGHLERFNPSVMALTPYVQEPQFIESTRIAPYKRRGLDVSVVLDLMIHDIDLIHSFVRSPMSSVDATGRSIFSDNVDIANARIRFESGCIANVTSSRISLKTERMLRIFQANAYLSADLYGKRSTIYRKQSDGPVESPEDIAIVKLPCEEGDALLAQSAAFLVSVAGGAPPLVDGRIAIQAMETAAVINDMIHAARTA